MESSNDDNSDTELDPRIQIELEKLNTATDEINRLEIELDEANTTFRMLLNESTRRLKLLSKKLGGCIERARPYYDALEIAKLAQIECQRAAVAFQRANEIHAAAKETVALAEQRFMSNQHEWQFDNAWQEMLNHATIKVMDAENQKAESGREHQRRATLFNAAEQKVQELEEKLHRNIIKSRPYFEEKVLCYEQLKTQKDRIEQLQKAVTKVKYDYAQSLKQLEAISEEIHKKRNGGQLKQSNREEDDDQLPPSGPREPGVGAELNTPIEEEYTPSQIVTASNTSTKLQLPDFDLELERCEVHSCSSVTTSSAVSEQDETETREEEDLDELRQRVRELAVRPVDGGGEGRSATDDASWESELNATVDKLDHMMLMKECAQELNNQYKLQDNSITPSSKSTVSLQNSPLSNKKELNDCKTHSEIIIDPNKLSEITEISTTTTNDVN